MTEGSSSGGHAHKLEVSGEPSFRFGRGETFKAAAPSLIAIRNNRVAEGKGSWDEEEETSGTCKSKLHPEAVCS